MAVRVRGGCGECMLPSGVGGPSGQGKEGRNVNHVGGASVQELPYVYTLPFVRHVRLLISLCGVCVPSPYTLLLGPACLTVPLVLKYSLTLCALDPF